MDSAATRRRRRRRRWRAAMLWLLTAVTTAVLVLIAGFVKEISKVPTAARPAALTATARAARHAGPAPSPAITTGREVADGSSGLSYPLLATPWRQGCPGTLAAPMFRWTAGENAVAGRISIGRTTIDWHGNACSGQLLQQFAYSGPADLSPVTMSVANAVEPVYYGGLRYRRTIQSSSAMRVSGHQAWVVRFLMTYPDAAREGLHWTSEAAAVVVVDRGSGQAPAVFYTSVPNNLGTSDIATLVSSLRLSPG